MLKVPNSTALLMDQALGLRSRAKTFKGYLRSVAGVAGVAVAQHQSQKGELLGSI